MEILFVFCIYSWLDVAEGDGDIFKYCKVGGDSLMMASAVVKVEINLPQLRKSTAMILGMT